VCRGEGGRGRTEQPTLGSLVVKENRLGKEGGTISWEDRHERARRREHRRAGSRTYSQTVCGGLPPFNRNNERTLRRDKREPVDDQGKLVRCSGGTSGGTGSGAVLESSLAKL